MLSISRFLTFLVVEIIANLLSSLTFPAKMSTLLIGSPIIVKLVGTTSLLGGQLENEK